MLRLNNVRLCSRVISPAKISLDILPMAAHSTPDEACLILVFPSEDNQARFRAYHWSTFGSNEGISLAVPSDFDESITVTSFVNRSSVHLLTLNRTKHECSSVVLDITKKVTEYQFKSQDAFRKEQKNQTSGGNTLIEVFQDVWTRFPVVAAIQSQATKSQGGRKKKQLAFVTDREHDRYAPHFANMVQTFEQRSRKPTGNELSGISVTAVAHSQLLPSIHGTGISTFLLGEWTVGLLCLIPIHIAITRENRFIPLKDGITSSELEKSLLGADVSKIVESLSLGWFESIFQSYSATKVCYSCVCG